MTERSKKALSVVLLAAAVAAVLWYVAYARRPLVEIVHVPETYARRAGDFTANVIGWLAPNARGARFRLNGGPWRELVPVPKRNFGGQFTIELAAEQLEPGAESNRIEIEAGALLRPNARTERLFGYDPSPVELPLTIEWSDADLDSQDGFWEVVTTDRGARVRPRPGAEGYDRILAVSGAFPQGRRIRSDVVFRAPAEGKREWGFGIFSLWGGHPDDGTHWPRRGWSFAMGWYWTKPGGVGGEISFKRGSERAKWVNTYRDYEIRPDVVYNMLFEVYPQRDAAGRHLFYRQRFKWWAEDEEPPAHWMKLTDVEGAVIPETEYAVALMAYNCQVDFGPVRIEAIAGARADEDRPSHN